MNYEDKDNKTIESIKRIYEQADSYGKEQIEKEFPELHGLSETEIIENLYRLLCAEVSIGTFEKYGLTDDAVFSWLKKQGEQKPAEWSEEDEENRINAIKYLEIFDAQAIHGDVAVPCINWLKSLKPQKH